MDVFTMVVLIVVVSTAAGTYNNYLRTQRLAAKSAPAEELEAEIADLRQRVQTLEKIVTDEGYRVSAEINRLERQG